MAAQGREAAGIDNQRIAERLREAAALLEAQDASPFRVGAYRRAADLVAAAERPLREVFDAEGREGLQALPRIGAGISSAIAEMLITGRWSQLERLRGGAEPEALLRTVPGIGRELARAIHGAAAIRASLAAMLGRRPARSPAALPAVELLLDVDREYRDKASAGKLTLITPRRFNPERKAWLPVLHARRGDWHFTALYSNTARAHELKRTHDWVVIYYYDGEHREGQCTVVTQARGPHAGERMVRGREAECLSRAA
jgi:hypothetical protein